MAIDRSRRLFLKGLGAATGLASAYFDSPVARAATATAPTRVLLVALQHGWGLDRAFGVITGSELNFTLPSPLSAFNAIKDQCVFIDGARGTLWGNAHDVSYSDILTAAVAYEDPSSPALGGPFPHPMGPSLDHVIGRHHKKRVLRVSARYASWGVQAHPLSFDDDLRLLSQFTNARGAYDSIIGPIREAAQPPMPGRRAIRNSLFQFLGKDADRLLTRVSGTERGKVEGYLQAVNDLGDRILNAPNVNLTEDEIPGRPPDRDRSGAAFSAEVDNYLELIKLVFRTDTHRAAVLGLGEGIDVWPWTDVNGGGKSGNTFGTDFHHDLAHHDEALMGSLDPRRAYQGWVEWYAGKIVKLVQDLALTPDVDGRSLLDNTIIMLTGEIGTGNHDTREKLHTLIGGGGGLRRGRWIYTPRVPARQRNGVFIGGQRRSGERVESGVNYGNDFSIFHTADVLKAVAQLAGVPVDRFGLEANNLAPMPLVLT